MLRDQDLDQEVLASALGAAQHPRQQRVGARCSKLHRLIRRVLGCNSTNRTMQPAHPATRVLGEADLLSLIVSHCGQGVE